MTVPPAVPSAPALPPVAALFDRVADTYENVGVPWFEPIAARLVELVAPVPGERAVDLGCGRGAVLARLADAVGAGGAAVGVDFAPRMVAAARERLAGHSAAVEVRLDDAAAPALRPGAADVVTASLVLFFLPDPAAALGRWVGLLRPGGRLAVSTFGPQDEVWKQIDALFTPYLPQGLLDARTSGAAGAFRSDEGVEGLLTDAGLVDVRTEHLDVEVAFADVDAWVRWSRSHGQLMLWSHVPEAEVPAVVASAAALLAEAPGGVLRQSVRYTLGVTPTS